MIITSLTKSSIETKSLSRWSMKGIEGDGQLSLSRVAVAHGVNIALLIFAVDA